MVWWETLLTFSAFTPTLQFVMLQSKLQSSLIVVAICSGKGMFCSADELLGHHFHCKDDTHPALSPLYDYSFD